VARHGAGKRAPRGRIGRAHGILVIPCSHTGVWADVRRKTPTGFWAKRQVFDLLPQRLAGRKKVSPAARCGDGRLVRGLASKRRPRVATRSKKGDALDPHGVPTVRRRRGSARVTRTPALCSPSACVGTCTDRSRKGSSLGKK
jgi:hypothetical protein